MHMHGHTFYVTGTEGGRIPEAAWWPGNTVLVGVAQARDIEFVANNPGDWMLHCHLPHHMMNQMSSNVGKMTRTDGGMPAGGDMNTGMGMLHGTPGAPMGDDYGPSLGRGMGGSAMTSTWRRPMVRFRREKAKAAMTPACSRHGQYADGMACRRHCAEREQRSELSAGRLHGRPNDGDGRNGREAGELRSCARAGADSCKGMMTFVRVLPPEQYDEVISRMKQANSSNDPYASILSGS